MVSFTQLSPNNPVYPSLPLYFPNVPTHLTLPIQSPSNIQSAVPIMNLPLRSLLQPTVSLYSQHSILRRPQYLLCPSLSIRQHVLCPHINVYKFVYIFITKWKDIYWKNGDEVEGKNCIAICMQLTAYSLLNSTVKFYQCYLIFGTLLVKLSVLILTGLSFPF
jgi:hypothetical protein